jgi:tetratricopeptide (TPR) repeat protein
MKRLTLVMLLALCASLSATAQQLSVQYVEGLVEVQQGAVWREVAAGDAVPASALLRLDDGAVAELAGGGTTLRLTRRGTYELASLARESAQTRSAGIGAFLTQRARAMGGKKATPDRDAPVAGVRAEAKDQGGVQWVGAESADKLISDGIERLAKGDYRAAYATFEEARDAASASGPDAARADFYWGYASYLNGDLVTALRHLEKQRPDPASSIYNDHALVLAQLLVETFAYSDAADLLKGYIGSGAPRGDNLQTARLLLGLSEKGLGDTRRAAENLRAAQQMNAGSDAGRAAAKLLETL